MRFQKQKKSPEKVAFFALGDVFLNSGCRFRFADFTSEKFQLLTGLLYFGLLLAVENLNLTELLVSDT